MLKKTIPGVLTGILLFCGIALFPWQVKAQVIFSGDFDGRLSSINLHRTLPDSLNNKTFNFIGFGELDLGYKHKKWDLFGSFFGNYTYGTNFSSIRTPGDIQFGFYQAWFRYHFSKYFSLQAGRIEIEYSDQRFFEARDWSGAVTSHNAVILHYLEPDTGAMADLGFAMNKIDAGEGLFSTNRTINNYRYMSYLWASKRLFDKQLSLTFTNIFSANDNGEDLSVLYGQNTLGLESWLALDDWNFDLAGYYQFGHVIDGRKLSAWYGAAYVSYSPASWLTLMPAYEYMSGDNFRDSAEWNRVEHGFSILYGHMTRSFGHSGVLTNGFRPNSHPGLNNLYFTMTFDILDNLSIEASYHWFSLADPHLRKFDPDSLKITIVDVPKSLLHQAELTFTYNPVPAVTLTLDYQLLFPGTGMKNYGGWNFSPGTPVSSAYIEVEWTPVFYPHKKRHAVTHDA